jgi:hypothetical protein
VANGSENDKFGIHAVNSGNLYFALSAVLVLIGVKNYFTFLSAWSTRKLACVHQLWWFYVEPRLSKETELQGELVLYSPIAALSVNQVYYKYCAVEP